MQVLLATALKAKKTTQAKFAESLGVSRAQLLAVVAGRNKPSIDFAFRLAREFGHKVDDLWEFLPTEVATRARPAQNRRR